MKKMYLAVLLVVLCFRGPVFSQSVAINTTGDLPDPTSMLDISSTTKGLLIPRMTTEQRNAIVNPAIGLVIYDTWMSAFFMYQNGVSQWQEIGLATWRKNGTDLYYTGGQVGIGNINPLTSLHISTGQPVSLVNHGFLMLGNTAVNNVIFDNDEIQARDNGVVAPLYLQRFGGRLQVGQSPLGTQPTTSLFIAEGQEAALTTGLSGYLMTGALAGQNLVMDDNEIQSRNNGNSATLFLQNEGGRLQVGSPLGAYAWIENNEIQGRSGAINFELVLQNDGSRVRIGNATDAGNAKLLITGGSDLNLADDASGFLMMGPIGGVNLVMDNNEIQARNNGAASPLSLNFEGGGVRVGNGSFSSGVEFGVTGDAIITGNVRIGNTSLPAGFKLGIDGNVICEELQVKLATNWADYVFEKDYDLKPLEEVEKFIALNKHLPGIPKGKLLEENGLVVGAMQKMQMEKIEELTLYIIELDKMVRELRAENEKMKKAIGELEKK